MTSQINKVDTDPAEAPDKGVGCGALVGLPCPRLQLRWEKNGPDWSNKTCRYELVMPLREYDIRRTEEQGMKGHAELVVEMGSTTVTGSDRRPVFDDGVQTPYRDGAHAKWDAEVLGLPIFAVCESDVTRIQPNVKDQPREL